MSTWFNSDDLLVKYGPNSFKSTSKGGSFATSVAGENIVELTIDLTGLADANAIMNDVVRIPASALVTKVEIVATTAATGANAVLDLGVVSATDRSSDADDDYFTAAVAQTSIDVLGDVVTLTQGVATHGVGIGAVVNATTYPHGVLVTAGYDTAAFTAGEVKVRIYYVPSGVVNP